MDVKNKRLIIYEAFKKISIQIGIKILDQEQLEHLMLAQF